MSRVETTIEVNAPVERCFAMWACLDCISCFMRYVVSTRCEDNQVIWHWAVDIPDGRTVEWDTVIDSFKGNHYLSWHSAQFAMADTSGSVQFESIRENRTRIRVEMMFNPPIGLGANVDEVFDKVIENDVLEDVEIFRSIVEEVLEPEQAEQYALSHRIAPESVFIEKTPSRPQGDIT